MGIRGTIEDCTYARMPFLETDLDIDGDDEEGRPYLVETEPEWSKDDE
jgi:hypothetical protein